MTDLVKLAQRRNRIIRDMVKWYDENPDKRYDGNPMWTEYEDSELDLLNAIVACGCGDDS